MLKRDRIYKRFSLTGGEKVALRAVRWEDLDSLLLFINTLVREKRGNSKSPLYAGFDTLVAREEEAEWLAKTLVSIERGETISVVADMKGEIIANGEVARGRYKDTKHHGHLGLTIIREYRGQGIGHKIIETLVRESHGVGLRTLDAEFLAENEAARGAYEKAGFRQAGIIPRKIFRSGRYFDGLIMARAL